MKVFVTGATGFVGSAVVAELVATGHSVLGLSRNEEKGAVLAGQGAEVLHGQLEDVKLLADAARKCDATIHCGFNHDFTRFQENCIQEGKSVTAMGEAYIGTNKPLLVTSGVGVMAGNQIVTEDTEVRADSHNPRKITEMTANTLIAKGVDVRAIRLPIVHGDSDPGFLTMLINIARQKGFVGYAGEGSNGWASVHRLDAARLYRLALEKGRFGARYHPVDEPRVPLREIAQVAAGRLGLEARSLTGDGVTDYFTWFSHFAQMDMNASSTISRRALGWEPQEIGLIKDLETSNHYFA